MKQKSKKKRHILILLCALHIVCSFVFWGVLRVYQQGYNATHRQPIAMASVSVTEQKASIQVLQHGCTIPVHWLQEESALYYAAHLITDDYLDLWIYALHILETDYS